MKNRNPILSFILSLFISGLGQVYNGELRKGLLYLIIFFPILLVLGLIGLQSEFTGFIIVLSIIFLYKLFISIEAYRTSKKANPYKLKSINKNWKYILFAIFGYMVMWFGTTLSRSITGYEAFEIPTPSMEPSIIVGDRVMATEIDGLEVQLGDIITFTREDGQVYLSRVVGLPEQTIQIISDEVFYEKESEKWTKTKISIHDSNEFQEFECELPNGKRFETKKTIKLYGKVFTESEKSNIEAIQISKDQVFVMGDNRNNSLDSRYIGSIPYENIDKKINYIWWSKDISRIGKKL